LANQEPVKLPREVAEALEKLGKRFPKDFILWHSSREDYPDAERDAWKTIHEFVDIPDAIFTLADALRYGYEIEEEPITVTITAEMQKKLREYYKCHDIHDRGTATSRRTTISHMCEIFGIKIQGVNE